jgi:hypothetical protein
MAYGRTRVTLCEGLAGTLERRATAAAELRGYCPP